MSTAPKFLKARDVAELCACDLKSVHNWVERGTIPAEATFRTPGRHLRFHPGPLRTWAVEQGFLPPDPPSDVLPPALAVGSAIVQAYLLLCELRPGAPLAETMGKVRELLDGAVKADPALAAAVAALRARQGEGTRP